MENQNGWIEFGRSQASPKSKAVPETKTFEPIEGRLFLFPSYFYHWTIQFESDEKRVRLAFDLMPSAQHGIQRSRQVAFLALSLFHAKKIGGHGTSIDGINVVSFTFYWETAAARQPALNTWDENYQGAVWTEAVQPLGPIVFIIRARVILLRDLGAEVSLQNALQFIQGLETLLLHIREHC